MQYICKTCHYPLVRRVAEEFGFASYVANLWLQEYGYNLKATRRAIKKAIAEEKQRKEKEARHANRIHRLPNGDR